MSKLTRIGFIRKTLAMFGGVANTYYADGPKSNMGGGSHPSFVKYKVEKFWDHMSPEARVRFATAMNNKVLISEEAIILGYVRTYINRGGHIVMVFKATTKSAKAGKKQPKTIQIAIDSFFELKDDAPVVTTTKAPTMTKDERMAIFWQEFGSSDAVTMIAKNFIEAMVDSSTQMCEDDPTSEVPSAIGIRAMAIDYAADTFADFKQEVYDEINRLMNEASFDRKVSRSVNMTIKFND